jgi:hypothetical protein
MENVSIRDEEFRKGKSMQQHIRVDHIHIILILLLVSGCTRPYNAYPGPPRPESEIAVITPEAGVKIYALDGRPINVTPGPAQGLDVKYNRIKLSSGEYTLTLIPQGIATIKTFVKVTVRVEAGKRYQVRHKFYPGTADARGYYKFWVENEQTGAVISEIVESRNPFQPRD